MKYTVKIIAAVVRNIHLKRVLQSADPKPLLNFWRVIYGNCLDMAVIEWCKLFGSDHEAHQPTHWKNVVPAGQHDEFRNGLFAAVGLTAAEWRDYWEQMKGYRDNHAAHFNEEYLQPENDPRYPDLTIALEAACYYYDRLLVIIEERNIPHRYPNDIREYCERFSEQAAEAAIRAIGSTADLTEEVW